MKKILTLLTWMAVGPGGVIYTLRIAAGALESDTLVTLEISFPLGEEFPFDSTGAVFMFDSPYGIIGACESEIDFTAKMLTATSCAGYTARTSHLRAQ